MKPSPRLRLVIPGWSVAVTYRSLASCADATASLVIPIRSWGRTPLGTDLREFAFDIAREEVIAFGTPRPTVRGLGPRSVTKEQFNGRLLEWTQCVLGKVRGGVFVARLSAV